MQNRVNRGRALCIEPLPIRRCECVLRRVLDPGVDFVIEAGGKLLPIEVKVTSKPRLGDCSHLRTFRQEYGRKARAGLLLHTGRMVEWLTPDVLAVPWWRVL